MEDLAHNNIADTQKQAASPAAPEAELPIKAAVHRYDSPFFLLLAPLIATRYAWLALEKHNFFNFLGKSAGNTINQSSGLKGYVSRNFAALGMGATFLSIIGLYSKNTLDDIRSLYAESVGYELGKKTEDVTLNDIFSKSQNSALEVTRSAYIRRTMGRVAAGLAFLVPWHKFRGIKADQPEYLANADAGLGAIGIYLFGEAFLRDPSFFDAWQKLASTALHHADNKTYEVIQPKNITSLLILHRNHLDKNYKLPDADLVEWKNEQALSTRVADLLNQTYNNTPNTDNVHFTIGKFNYLIGFGLLDKFPESLAFVELASKSIDMRDVKIAAAAIKSGQPSHEVFQQFGIDTNNLLKAKEADRQTPEELETPEKRFMSVVQSIIKEAQSSQRTHMDFATQTSEASLGLGV